MKTLLYIGNKLSENGTVTTIDTLSKNLQQESYNVVSASDKKNKIFRLLDMLWHIVKYRNNTDYVLIDTYSTLNFYYAYFCSKLCRYYKLKYIPILHGGDLPNRLKKSPKKSIQLFKNAYLNIAPSLYLKSHFEDFGFKNLKYIPNTIEIKDYKFSEKIFNTPKLLWVRSFVEIYNPQLAIKVLQVLKTVGIEANLCMIGPEKDGSLESVKELAKQLDLKVEFTGKLSKKEWHNKAKDFNVFINTTNIDNTPVSVMEAMALGLPVVSTNIGGMPFLINDGEDGVLVPPNDEVAFVKAISKLINDEAFAKHITYNARKKAETFDWEVVKHKWFSVLS